MPLLSPLEQQTRKNAVRLLMLGALLLAVLAFLPSCRKDTPPAITVCIGDGAGGADCLLPNQTEYTYWSPKELENAWITTQEDMAKFSAWCYGVKPEKVKPELEKLRTRIKLRGVIQSPSEFGKYAPTGPESFPAQEPQP